MERPRIHFNETLNGIELFFNKRPDVHVLNDIKSQGFRWSYQYKKWYAQRTPEREQFVNTYFDVRQNNERGQAGGEFSEALTGKDLGDGFYSVTEKDEVPNFSEEKVGAESASKHTEDVGKASLGEADEKKINVFASYFDTIGNEKIYENANVSLVNFQNRSRAGYFEKEKMRVSIKDKGKTICIEELDGKTSEGVCKVHTLSIDGFYYPNVERIALIYLVNDLKVHTVAELFDAVKSCDFDFKELRVDTTEVKESELFSPFREVVPLKEMPENWTKEQLVEAMCSGQIYRAIYERHFTGDYAYDVANNYSEGKELSLPFLAKEYFENWNDRTTSIQVKEVEKNTCEIQVSDDYQSVKLFFDLDFDMEKGQLRHEELGKETILYNQMMKQLVVAPKDVCIQPDKFYDVSFLEMDENTGRYVERSEMTQGISMINFDEPEKFHWYYALTTGAVEKMIVPDLFYTVSNLLNPTIIDYNDRRFIPMGNFHALVTGQTLLEKVEEGWRVPYVSAKVHCGNTFEAVKGELSAYIDCTKTWAFDTSEIEVDYKDSLNRVCDEEKRVAEILQRGKEKPRMSSLTDRISDIEKRRKEEAVGRGQESSEKVQPAYVR